MKIGMADTMPLEDPELYQRIYDSLPGIRQAKADSLKVMRAKCQSVAAGWLISRYAGDCAKEKRCVSMAERSMEQSSDPKEILYYNLSHSGELAACVVAGFPVGIDVELVRKCRMPVAEKYFSRRECMELEQAGNEEERAELFTKIWTIKESSAKLTGEGIGRICSRKKQEETDEICTVSKRLQKGTDIYYLTVAVYEADSQVLTESFPSIEWIGYEIV